MAGVTLTDEVFVLASDIEVDDVSELIDIMNNNFIYPADILKAMDWELPDFQEAARQLDIELLAGLGGMSSGDNLYQAFKKLDNYEKRVFMLRISDCVVGYLATLESELPNELS